jgi:hypothetical protein
MKRMKRMKKTISTVIAGLTRNPLPIIAPLFLYLTLTSTVAQPAVILPSEQSGQSLSPQSATTPANILPSEREVLFGPTPPGGSTVNNGGAVAGVDVPVTGALWLLIALAFLYGIIQRMKTKRELRAESPESNKNK